MYSRIFIGSRIRKQLARLTSTFQRRPLSDRSSDDYLIEYKDKTVVVSDTLLLEVSKQLEAKVRKVALGLCFAGTLPWLWSITPPIKAKYTLVSRLPGQAPKFEQIGYTWRPGATVNVIAGTIVTSYFGSWVCKYSWRKMTLDKLLHLVQTPTPTWFVFPSPSLLPFPLSMTYQTFQNRLTLVPRSAASLSVAAIPAAMWMTITKTLNPDPELPLLSKVTWVEILQGLLTSMLFGAFMVAPLTVPVGTVAAGGLSYYYRYRVLSTALSRLK